MPGIIPLKPGPIGLTGLPGRDGTDGSNGIDGLDGANGATWYNGLGTPNDAVGSNGDYYLQSTGSVYQKVGGAYAYLFNIRGPQSPTPKYTYTQNVPSSVWTINHFLGGYPSVTIVDSAGTVVDGAVRYLNSNTITATFSATFSGKAFLT